MPQHIQTSAGVYITHSTINDEDIAPSPTRTDIQSDINLPARILARRHDFFAKGKHATYKKGVWMLPSLSREHQSRVTNVSRTDQGRGAITLENSISANAMVTNDKNLTLVTQGADCLMGAFYDPQAGVIAVAHLSWMGLGDNLLANIISRMRELGSDPGNIQVFFGPSLKSDCLCFQINPCDEKGAEIVRMFQDIDEAIVPMLASSRDLLNTELVVQHQLDRQGLDLKNIVFSPHCTQCKQKDYYYLYYSLRRDKKLDANNILAVTLL